VGAQPGGLPSGAVKSRIVAVDWSASLDDFAAASARGCRLLQSWGADGTSGLGASLNLERRQLAIRRCPRSYVTPRVYPAMSVFENTTVPNPASVVFNPVGRGGRGPSSPRSGAPV
jgi:hypothetical protein